MQTYYEYLHYCQIEEVKNRQSKHTGCCQIASGKLRSLFSELTIFRIVTPMPFEFLTSVLILADME